MAPEIRQYAETRQTNAATSTASPIVVRTTPTLNARKYELQEFSVSIRTHTYRIILNFSVITENMTWRRIYSLPSNLRFATRNSSSSRMPSLRSSSRSRRRFATSSEDTPGELSSLDTSARPDDRAGTLGDTEPQPREKLIDSSFSCDCGEIRESRI